RRPHRDGPRAGARAGARARRGDRPERRRPRRTPARRVGGRGVSGQLLLAHGDDGYGLDDAVRTFADEVAATERVEIVPERSPDEAAIDRARLESGTMTLFGAHLAVLRQPLRAAGRSTAAADRLVALVDELPDGSALALVEERPSRDLARP